MEQFILKELDLIDSTISRLDSQIQSTKNICIILWTAWIGWFISNDHFIKDGNNFILTASILFPVLFWCMDYQFRKPLLTTSRRQKRISLFINSNKYSAWTKDQTSIRFPVLDPVGWHYEDSKIDDKFLLNEKEISPWFYKDAKYFYPPLIIISLLFLFL